MKDKAHFFLGLAAEADARNCRRMSFLMAANSFRVGTRFSCSRFCFSFTDSISQVLNFQPEGERSIPTSIMREQVDEASKIVRVLAFNEPHALTVTAHSRQIKVGVQQPDRSSLTFIADKLTSDSVREFYRSPRLNGHFSLDKVLQ